jgi:drug/metabolite transporter (DMT)-like permease
MIAVVLAALSAIVWGAGDFSGGKAAQRLSGLLAAVLSKTAGVPLLVVYLLLLDTPLRTASLGWGLLAGVIGMTGIIIFYRALAGGAMSVVAPVSAVTSALVPLVIGLLIEAVPGTPALIGAGTAIVAIALVSMAPDGAKASLRLVVMALASGAAFGGFFVCLERAGEAAGGEAGLWPIAAAAVSALALGYGLLLWRRRPGAVAAASAAPGPKVRHMSGSTLVWLLAAGFLDLTANALYLVAVQDGLLSIVAPIASLYPVSTVLLAMAIDRERMRPVQLAGLGLAATALVLVAS